MKTRKMISATLIAVSLLSACKKEEPPAPKTTTSTSVDIASKVIGNYTGSGENDAHEFMNQGIVISKVSDTRIKISPAAGNTYIIAFEIDIAEAIAGSITSTVAENDNDRSLAITTSATPYTISFEIPSPYQSFGGQKN